jgi:hypothetical protein
MIGHKAGLFNAPESPGLTPSDETIETKIGKQVNWTILWKVKKSANFFNFLPSIFFYF